VGDVAKNFHDNIFIRKAILEEQKDILRLHLHEEHFVNLLEERNMDVGIHNIYLFLDKLLNATTCNVFFEETAKEMKCKNL